MLLRCAGSTIALNVHSRRAYRFFADNFGGMRCANDERANVEYDIRYHSNGFSVVSPHSRLQAKAANLGELVYILEGDIVVQLQLRRPNLMFLHAAVVSHKESTCVVTGPSGAGKSTLCWGLLHHGFRYTSDELAPISLSSNTVSPYAHALCLKREPQGDYPLPDSTIRSERGYHLPMHALPTCFQTTPPPLRHLVFVQYDHSATMPVITEIEAAEAAARLYPNVLNALAHDADGLRAVAALVSGLRCVTLRSAQLKETCDALARALQSS